MGEESLESPLEKQIRKQVNRVGKTVAGEFNEATEGEAVKYHIKVSQSVNLLESLCIPLIDKEYTEKKEELLAEDDGKKDELDLLSQSKVKYRLLIELLHQKGVL